MNQTTDMTPFNALNELPLSQDQEREALSSQSKKIRKNNTTTHESPAKEKNKQKRTLWNSHEDAQVLSLVQQFGEKWTKIGKMIGRTGKQVRDRYIYTINPELIKDDWTQDEDNLILSMYPKVGSNWSHIAYYLPGRSACQVKNRFNWKLKKLITLKEEANPSLNFDLAPSETACDPSLPSIERDQSYVKTEESDEINVKLSPPRASSSSFEGYNEVKQEATDNCDFDRARAFLEYYQRKMMLYQMIRNSRLFVS